MATKTFQLGRLTLREDWTASETLGSDGVRTVSVSGQESPPRLPAASVHSQRSDLMDMKGSLLPAVFGVKSTLNGFYWVTEVSGELEDWQAGIVVWRWSLTLQRAGTISEIDIESRLSGGLTRANSFSAVGERSHAPAIGAVAYWAGASVPTTVDRVGSDGTVRVYRGLGLTVNPRWAISPDLYGVGRCRFIDGFLRERAGCSFLSFPAGTWQLTNGLVSVVMNVTGTFDIGIWDTGAWAYTTWKVQTGSPYVAITSFDYLTVLRNEYEAITLRLTKSFSPNGRLYCDLTLRRGSRVVEIYLQNEYGTNMKVVRATAATGAQTSGYVTASANDAAGNRYVVGSAGTFTADTVNGGVEKLATPVMDVMVSSVFNGNTAIAGDTAADLYAQYLGMPGEMIQGVKR